MPPAPYAWLLAGILSLASAAWVAPAAAQPSGARPPAAPTLSGREANVSKAREHFQQGQRFFKVERYREALEQFKEAFVTVEDPVFLYNIALCHRLLGEKTEALRFYRRYAEATPSASERARARKWIAELEAAAGASPAAVAPPPVGSAGSPPPSSSAKPSAKPPSPSVSPAPSLAVSPPPPAPAEAQPASSVTLTVPPPEPSPDRPIYKRWWFWAGVGAAVVLGAVAVSAAASDRPMTCGSGFIRCEQL